MALTERLALLIDADTRGAVRGLDNLGRSTRTQLGGAQSMVSSFVDGLRRAGPAIAGVGAIAAAGLYQSVQAAGDLSSATGALDAIFKGAAGEARAFAEDAERLGLSQLDASRYAALLGGQLSNMGFGAAEAGDQAQTLIERAADLSVGFGSTAEAVNAISAVLRGEYDTIERFAIQLKQSDVNARVAEKGLSGLTGEALKNAQATAALELLYDQAANRIGAYGSEANEAAREQAELTAKFENLQAEIGTAVLPAFVELLDQMNTGIDVGRQLAGVVGDLGSAFAAAAPDVEELLPAWLKGAGDALGFIGDAFAPGKSDLELIPPEEWDAMQQRTARAAADWLGLGDAVDSVGAMIGGFVDEASGGADGLGEIAQSYESIFDELFGYQDALRGVEESQDKVRQAQRSLSDAQRDAASAADDVRQAHLDVAAAAIVNFDAHEAARRGIADYADEQRAAVDPVFAFIRALERQEELLEGVKVAQDGTKLTASGNKPSLLDFAENAADVESAAYGLAGAIQTGEVSVDDLNTRLKKWVSQGLLTEAQAARLSSVFADAAAKATGLEGATAAHAAASGVAEARMEAEAEAAERVRDAQERLRDAQERLVTAQERVTTSAEAVNDAHRDSARRAYDLDRALFNLNAEAQKNPGFIEDARRKTQEWVDQGLIPAEERARLLRDMLQGINDAADRFGGSHRLHIEVTSNAMAFLDFLAGSPTLTSGSIRLRDRLLEQYMPSGATGLTVPGPMGQPRMVMAHGGERLVSNMDLNRMSTAPGYGGPLVHIDQIVVPDVASGIREAFSETKAAAHRAGLG